MIAASVESEKQTRPTPRSRSSYPRPDRENSHSKHNESINTVRNPLGPLLLLESSTSKPNTLILPTLLTYCPPSAFELFSDAFRIAHVSSAESGRTEERKKG
jgi:hypothetical protein